MFTDKYCNVDSLQSKRWSNKIKKLSCPNETLNANLTHQFLVKCSGTNFEQIILNIPKLLAKSILQQSPLKYINYFPSIYIQIPQLTTSRRSSFAQPAAKFIQQNAINTHRHISHSSFLIFLM